MRRLPFTSYPGSKLYFTEADLSSQQSYRIGWYELSVGLKLWLLMADRVILSTGHMLRSPLTFQWLEHEKTAIAELAEKQVIIPSLSNQYSCCKDFAQDQVADSPAAPEAEEFRLCAMDRGRFLDDLFPAAITWSPTDESQWFRKMMHSHLTDRFSPLRTRLIGVSDRSLAALAEAVAGCGDFRRGTLRALVQQHCPRRAKMILRYGDCFYYLSGARTKDAWPLLHSNAAVLLQDQVAYSAKIAQVAAEPSRVWRAVMDEWSLPPSALASLPVKEVAGLREDSIGKKARRTFAGLMDSARRLGEVSEPAQTAESAMQSLMALLSEEMGKQRTKHARWRAGGTLLLVAGWATSGIATACGCMSLGTSLALGLLSFLVGAPFVSPLEKKVGHTELVLLADRIGRRARP